GAHVDPPTIGGEREGADVLHGRRHSAAPVQRAPPDPVLVLQAAVRPGHEPGHRPPSRAVRHVAADAARAARPAAVGAAGGRGTRASIIVQTDDARESRPFACLLGYGAEAIYPRIALATVAGLAAVGRARDADPADALIAYKQAIEEGVLKVLSKMGISYVDSYRGAQIFDAVGIAPEVVDLCFEATPSPIGGLGFEDIAADVLAR